MSQIEELAEIYGRHIATPWQRTVAGAQRIIMVVYNEELERHLRARKEEFKTQTHAANHDWHEIDLTNAFSTWIANDEYRDAYFDAPGDLKMKLDAEFTSYVAEQIQKVLLREDITENSVVAILGVASLFGFTKVSQVMKQVEADVKGRLVVFFPGQYEQNNYRLLDARDGWNYMAIPITTSGTGGAQ